MKKVTNTAIIFLITIIIFVLFVPSFYPHQYYTINPDLMFAKISRGHIFGNDALGRDMFIRVCIGIRNSMLISISAIFFSVFIGVIYGSCAGYKGKNAERFMVIVINVLESVPDFLLAVLLMIFFSNLKIKNLNGSIAGMFFTLIFLSWIPIARITKNEAKKVANNDFVLYSKLKGAGFFHIFSTHIFPNIKGTVLVTAIQRISSGIFLETTLSFVGIGIQPPEPSLGSMINQSIRSLRIAPHLLFLPSICLIFVVLLFSILGESLINTHDGSK